MKLDDNVVLVTGGGSGIGRGLAEAFHARGNQVVVAGRRRAALDRVTAANPGMAALELDVADPASIERAVRSLERDFPTLNVLVNNAGVQWLESADSPTDEAVLTASVATNLLGPIRLTSALLERLKAQPRATIVHVSSMLALLPMADGAIYCATKAALHSYALAQRYALRGSTVEVIEILPPYVQSELHDGKDDPRAMRCDDFVAETMALLGTDAVEIVVERARGRLGAAGTDAPGATARFNDMLRGIAAP